MLAMLVLLVGCTSRCVPFGCRLAPVARQDGLYGPGGRCYRRGCGSGMCKAGFAGFAPCAVFLLSLSGPDALHHGRYGPDRHLRGVFSARSSTSLSWCRGYHHGRDSPGAVHLVVDVPVEFFNIPVVAQRHFPWSRPWTFLSCWTR